MGDYFLCAPLQQPVKKECAIIRAIYARSIEFNHKFVHAYTLFVDTIDV